MNRIREVRKAAGVSQTELCAAIGVSQSALSGYETGRYEPDCALWLGLAHFFGVSVDYLMGEGCAAVAVDENPQPPLRGLRISRKMTQQEVADFLGVERTTYVKYECGASEPPTATLVRLADFFGVSVDFLVGHTFPPASKPADNISLRIKALREGRGLTQQGLAVALGVSQATVGMLESGKREPSMQLLCCIADFFHVSTDCVLCRSEIVPLYSAADSSCAEFAEAFRSLDEEGKARILNSLNFELRHKKK